MSKLIWKIFWAILLILGCVSIDFYSKDYIKNQVLKKNENFIISNFLQLKKVWNSGVAFGMFDFAGNKKVFFIIMPMILILIYMLIRNFSDNFLFWPLVLILSGAIGNLLDRFLFGAVFDFIDFHINDLHFPTFNFADSLISSGATFLMLYLIKKDNYEKNSST